MADSDQKMSFVVGGETVELIEALKAQFNVTSTAAVLKRGLALARLVAELQRDDHTVTIIGKNDARRDLVLIDPEPTSPNTLPRAPAAGIEGR